MSVSKSPSDEPIVTNPGCSFALHRAALSSMVSEELDITLTRRGTMDGKEEYDGGAFSGCRSLVEVLFGNHLKVIGPLSFANTSLRAVVLKEGVESIGSFAFKGCVGLETVILPNSLHLFDVNVFKGCTKLHEIVGSKKQEDILEHLKCSSVTLIRLCINDSALKEIKQVLKDDPEAAMQTDTSGRTPLSYYCRSGSSEVVLVSLLAANPKAANEADQNGNTPLHYLCKNSHVTVAMLEVMVAASPDAAKQQNKNEVKTPPQILSKKPFANFSMFEVLLDRTLGKYEDLHEELVLAFRQNNRKAVEAAVEEFAFEDRLDLYAWQAYLEINTHKQKVRRI